MCSITFQRAESCIVLLVNCMKNIKATYSRFELAATILSTQPYLEYKMFFHIRLVEIVNNTAVLPSISDQIESIRNKIEGEKYFYYVIPNI